MSWLDWCIVVIPMGLLIWLAIYSGKFARGIVDFLAAGRIAGRYVLCIGELTSALSVISLVAGCEQNYQTGYAVGFWGAITAPVWTFFALSGYCTYRWRQTRCLSLGQFIELRYGGWKFHGGRLPESRCVTGGIDPLLIPALRESASPCMQ